MLMHCIIRGCGKPVPMGRRNRAKDDRVPAWLCDDHYFPIARALHARIEAFEEAWQRERQQRYEDALMRHFAT